MTNEHGNIKGNMCSDQPELITSEVHQFWLTRNRLWAKRLSGEVKKQESLTMRR